MRRKIDKEHSHCPQVNTSKCIYSYVLCKQEIHLLLRNEKKQGKEKKSVKYKTFPGRCGFWGGRAGVELRIWLKQGEENSLLARILKILEEARKRLSR